MDGHSTTAPSRKTLVKGTPSSVYGSSSVLSHPPHMEKKWSKLIIYTGGWQQLFGQLVKDLKKKYERSDTRKSLEKEVCE